jgi:short subunit dehydrogenase-like uncharacterized protein
MTEVKELSKGKLLIYGATGHTGTLICNEAARRGINFEIAGRSEDKLSELAAQLNVPYHVFQVQETAGWEAALKGKTALLNIAGPFSETAEWAMEACIKFKVHYFDITAEVDIYRLTESKDEAAKAAGIMLLSGAGLFASYDPLVLHTVKRVENPVAIRAAFKYSGGFTPGSIASSANIVNAGILVRKGGEIKKLNGSVPAVFDFGNRPEECFPTPLGGVILCYKSTGIPDIEEYFQMALPAASGEAATVGISKTPDTDESSEERSKIVAEVTGENGEVVRSMIDMPSGYMPTVTSSIAIVSRALDGSYKTGFQSPASAYGEELLDSLSNVHITDF